MGNNLRRRIRDALITRNQTSFQQVVNKIFVYKYKEDYTPVKLKRDKGSDGILFNDTILAVYAPTPRIKNIFEEFERKARSDFQSYEDNWKSSHPNFQYLITANQGDFFEGKDKEYGNIRFKINDLIIATYKDNPKDMIFKRIF